MYSEHLLISYKLNKFLFETENTFILDLKYYS